MEDKVEYRTMEYGAFLRSQGIQRQKVSFFLGAGASIESGVLSASQCILEWKKNIFDTMNPSSSYRHVNFKDQNCILEVQRWIDSQGIYPKINDENEYSFFAEAAYPDEHDRCSYFNSKFSNITRLSVGYKLLAYFAKQDYIQKIWTTNFDDLIQKAMYGQNISTIEVTLDCVNRIKYTVMPNCVMVIKLHGDYKYSKIKNTAKELDTQVNYFVEALKDNSTNTDLIVLGYSGRDISVMSGLKKAFSTKGIGRLFWLSCDRTPNDKVKCLLKDIALQGRNCYYVLCSSFDSVMLDIAEIKYGTQLDKKSEYSKLISNDTGFAMKPFLDFKGEVHELLSTNSYLVKCPQLFYQFLLTDQEKSNWLILREKINKSKNLIAERYKDFVCFLGSQTEMQSLFLRNISISSIPFSNDGTNQHMIFSLMTSAFLRALVSKNEALDTDGYRYIWNKNTKKNINANYSSFNGIEIKLGYCTTFPGYNIISILPKCYICMNSQKIEKSIIKNISDQFYSTVNQTYKSNLGVYEYVTNWFDLLTNHFKVSKFYFADNNEMAFLVGHDTALIGVVSNQIGKSLENKRIIYHAIKNLDPQLSFYNKQKNCIVQDYHPMRGLINNAPYEMMYTPNITEHIKIAAVVPIGEKQKFFNFINKLNYSHSVKNNREFVLPYSGFYDIYKIPLLIPPLNGESWQEFSFPTDKSENGCKILGNKIIEAINIAQKNSPESIILIYIPKYLEYYEEFLNNIEHFDLHDYIKAYTVSKGIPTQFIKEKTLEYDDIASVAWTLSLALYVKSGRIPWTLKNLTEEQTAFVGIGYSVDSINPNNPIVLGCSHIFSADGQSIKYRLSKIRNPQFDFNDRHRKNPYLTEDEAYRLGCNINDLFRKSFATYPKRIVIHKRTPFRKSEIDGIVKSFSLYGITNIDLITITYEDSLRVFELRKDKIPDTYPVQRGVGFVADEKTIYLFTHGLAHPINNVGKYVMGGKSLPVPLKITKYYGESSASKISNDILGLTRMNWNNFNLYSKLPCTIESSNNIAKIGYLLSSYDGAEYDYRLFI